MIVLDCPQGSREWLEARLGIPTASCFDEILTPATLKLAKGATLYRNLLLAEWMLGYPIEQPVNGWMERGIMLEPQARASYELTHDVVVRTVGLVLRDDRQVGGSPDGLVGEDGGIELKCPAPQTHVGYLMEPTTLVQKYRHQVQGCLYLTGREWWDLVSYCPGLPTVEQRVTPDLEYHKALEGALEWFLADLADAKAILEPHRELVYANV